MQKGSWYICPVVVVLLNKVKTRKPFRIARLLPLAARNGRTRRHSRHPPTLSTDGACVSARVSSRSRNSYKVHYSRFFVDVAIVQA